MNYYIECKAIGTYKKTPIFNQNMEEIGEVHFLRKGDEDVLVKTQDQPTLHITSNRLKLKSRYVLKDDNGETLGKVRIGVKIIHSIIEQDKYYFAKAAFWNIHYKLFENRSMIGEVKLVRQNKIRYFHITMKHENHVAAISLFLLAHAIRIKSLLA